MKMVLLVLAAFFFALFAGSLLIERSMRRQRKVLVEMMGDGRWHRGLDLVKASGGRLSRGGIYVALLRLEDDGFVESKYDDAPHPVTGEIRRRLFRLRPAMGSA